MQFINDWFEGIKILYSICIKFFTNHIPTPTPDFLSDVAAFEAAVIALAIPLSLEMVSRISERYQSEVITKKFLQEWENKWLPILLIANIIVAVSLRFFVDDKPTSDIWKILSWLTFAGFLFITVVLIKFFILLKKYITDMEFILKELLNEAEELLK